MTRLMIAVHVLTAVCLLICFSGLGYLGWLQYQLMTPYLVIEALRHLPPLGIGIWMSSAAAALILQVCYQMLDSRYRLNRILRQYA